MPAVRNALTSEFGHLREEADAESRAREGCLRRTALLIDRDRIFPTVCCGNRRSQTIGPLNARRRSASGLVGSVGEDFRSRSGIALVDQHLCPSSKHERIGAAGIVGSDRCVDPCRSEQTLNDLGLVPRPKGAYRDQPPGSLRTRDSGPPGVPPLAYRSLSDRATPSSSRRRCTMRACSPGSIEQSRLSPACKRSSCSTERASKASSSGASGRGRCIQRRRISAARGSVTARSLRPRSISSSLGGFRSRRVARTTVALDADPDHSRLGGLPRVRVVRARVRR
jgi:hypothetical protein